MTLYSLRELATGWAHLELEEGSFEPIGDLENGEYTRGKCTIRDYSNGASNFYVELLAPRKAKKGGQFSPLQIRHYSVNRSDIWLHATAHACAVTQRAATAYDDSYVHL